MSLEEEAAHLRINIQKANREVARFMAKHKGTLPEPIASLDKSLKELGFKSYKDFEEKDLFPEIKNPDNAG